MNFCSVCICDEQEYRAFVLHPIYRYYHNVQMPKSDEDLNQIVENNTKRQAYQKVLEEKSIVQEAISYFSVKNLKINWTKKSIDKWISIIVDCTGIETCFFSIFRVEFYSEASDLIHGSLYGYLNSYGISEDKSDTIEDEGYNMRLYKSNSTIVILLGLILHNVMTIVSNTTDISRFHMHSTHNRKMALQLLDFVLERKPLSKEIRDYCVN